MSSYDRWAELSNYDIQTARAMFDSGRYLYVLFCSQQSVEKALKALIVKKTGEFPPRTHTLMRLANVSGLEIDDEMAELFRELSNYYIQTRYPEEISALGMKISRDQTRLILEQTEESVKWLLSLLKQETG